MYARYPHIKQVGLCHSGAGTAEELAHDLDLDPADLRFSLRGHQPYGVLSVAGEKRADGSYVSIYPDMLQAFAEDGRQRSENSRCQNIVRYERGCSKAGLLRDGVVRSTSRNIRRGLSKPGREDLIERYQVPLDRYPKRCVEQVANWHKSCWNSYKTRERIELNPPARYASNIMNAIWTGEPSVVYGNVRNEGLIDNLPQGCCVEVACLVDANGIQPTKVRKLPAHPAALMLRNQY